MKRWNDHRDVYEAAKQKEDWFFSKLRAAWEAKRPEAIQRALAIAVENAQLPWTSTQSHRVRFDDSNGILLIDYEFPDVERLSFAEHGPKGLKPLAKTRLKELQDRLVYNLAMRVLFDVACITGGFEPVQGIALNGHVTFIDKTNGRERTEIILSLFVKPDDLLGLTDRRSHR